MARILEIIGRKTEGKCFSSYRYCYDHTQVPSIDYTALEDRYESLKDYAEDVRSPKPRDLTEMSVKAMAAPPLFKYFLDGSRHVYKVDDVLYGKQVYPVVAGQISVACCSRVMEGNRFDRFKMSEAVSYSVISLPDAANSVGIDNNSFFLNICKGLNSEIEKTNMPVRIQKILCYPRSDASGEKKTFESKGIATIQDEMIECEKLLVQQLVQKKKLNSQSFLIKDGSIQYKQPKGATATEITRIRNNYRFVVGVSKQFNPNLMKDHKGQSSAGQIAALPLYHRTPAYLWQPGERFGNVRFAIWYVRIRERQWTESPYAGVLKIEKVLVSEDENENGLSSDEIDTISANIINERNPVCYGNDSRWANHLYPVYLTECYCKSRFLSDQFFMNLF